MEIKIKGVNISYEEFGSGRPFLGIHGWQLDHRSVMADFEPIFNEREGWRRLYPDLPGMGTTRCADWIKNANHYLDILLEFMQTLAPNEHFTVAGSSYGSYLARGIVHELLNQLNGLMISVPVIEADFDKRIRPEFRVLHEDVEFLASLKPEEGDAAEMVVAQSMELLEAFRSTIWPAVALADQEFLKGVQANYESSYLVDAHPEPFPAPTLILTGRFDHWCGYQEAFRLLDNYPRATFAVLDRAGHALSLEQKSVFRALASEWLDRVEEYIYQKG